jgi:hypothetical protein
MVIITARNSFFHSWKCLYDCLCNIRQNETENNGVWSGVEKRDVLGWLVYGASGMISSNLLASAH